MSAPRISDPAKTMERCYDRLEFALEMLAHYEAEGMPACAAGERRKIAGLRGTITRCNRMLAGHLDVPLRGGDDNG